MKDIKILAVTAAVVLVIITAATVTSCTKHNRIRDEMDAKELHYDADDLFLMLNASNNLAGFYDGPEVLQHMIIRVDAPSGVYDAFFKNGYMYLERTDVDSTISIALSRDQAQWIEDNYKSGYPALVYREG